MAQLTARKQQVPANRFAARGARAPRTAKKKSGKSKAEMKTELSGLSGKLSELA